MLLFVHCPHVAMPRYSLASLRYATLCCCLCISACTFGEFGEVHQRLAADRHDTEFDGFAGRLTYVPGPLRPNNCGTPDRFKPCLLAATRPEKPTVMIEELQATDAATAAPATNALLDYSRLRVEHLILPTGGDSKSLRHEIGDAVESPQTQ